MIPLTLITFYYAFCTGVMAVLLLRYPVLRDFFPIGGIGDLAGRNTDSFEPVYSTLDDTVLAPYGPLRLAFASVGAAILIIPVSWVYFITSRTKEVDQSFVQTIIIMPIVVTGISMIVLNSLALAFSLAGIRRCGTFSFFPGPTLARDVHICRDQHWPRLGYWRTRCRHGDLDGFRICQPFYLEARIRQGVVRAVLFDADTPRSNRGRLLICAT